ncbi:MAG: alanine racemase [Firmicutes bacterium]|nr:alanine racemase [Bacillota bacterium]
MWEGQQDRPTVAEVDLASIGRNIAAIRRRIGPGPEIMAVVKADAYGHGAVQVATTALTSGATWLGVALVEEGVVLRKSGIIAPILVFGQLFPSQARRALRYSLSCTVSTYEFAEALSVAATQEGKKGKCHIKVDTGMGRIGVLPRQAASFVRRVAMLPNVEVEGIYTHFATADADDKSFAREQLSRFMEVIETLRTMGVQIQFRHAANSAACVEMPEARLDLVRPGILMYGLSPFSTERFQKVKREMDIRPALSLKTRVSFVKRVPAGTPVSYGSTYVTREDTVIATLPVGYADGLSRGLSNRGEVLIRGRRLPIVGRICMDQCMVDAGNLEVEVGDEAVLIGRQGDQEISAEEVADKLGTISYEVVCAISKRVPRVYSSQP